MKLPFPKQNSYFEVKYSESCNKYKWILLSFSLTDFINVSVRNWGSQYETKSKIWQKICNFGTLFSWFFIFFGKCLWSLYSCNFRYFPIVLGRINIIVLHHREICQWFKLNFAFCMSKTDKDKICLILLPHWGSYISVMKKNFEILVSEYSE